MRPMRTLVTTVLSLAAATAPAQDEPFLHPPGQPEILATHRAEHPRVLVTSADWERARSAIDTDTTIARWHAELLEQAEAILGQPPSEYIIPDGKRLLATSRRVLTRVQTLAYAHRTTGDPRYADRAWAELDAAAGFKDWNPSHFLDTGEMTAAFAIGYDWLYDEWDDAQRRRLRDAIVTRGLSPGLGSYRGEQGYGWWVKAHHNWNQVCNGGLALGALAIADEEPEIAAEILHEGMLSLRLAMREYAPDGGWAEGPGYWGYATVYNAMHLAALESALGSSFGYADYPGFAQTGEYPPFVSGPTGRTFNYADGGDSPIRAPQLFWLADRFGQPDFAAFEARAAAPSALDVLWGTRAGLPDGMSDLPLDRHFEGIGIVTMRSAWGDPDALFVGLRGGSNAVNHSHLEIGSFVFDALGVRWAIDLGGDDYNMPGYFGAQRWSYYRLRAEGQNTIVLDPGDGPEQDPKAAGAIVDTTFSPHQAGATVDLSKAYPKALAGAGLTRTALLGDGRSRLVIEDRVNLSPGTRPLPAWWFMHTRAEIDLDPGARRAVLRQDGKALAVEITEPVGATFSVMDAAPLPTSPHPAVQNANTGVRKLAIALTLDRTMTIRVVLSPLPAGEAAR